MSDRIPYTAAEFAVFLDDFVPALPGNWTVKVRDFDGPGTYATLTRSDGLAISLTASEWKGKFHCYPSLPKDPRGGMQILRDFLTYEERKAGAGTIEAYAALPRPPQIVAKDFNRRVVEPYAKLFPRIVEQTRERISEQADFVSAVEKLCRRYGQRFDRERIERDSHKSVYPGSGSPIYKIDVSHGYAKIELSSVALDKLDAVLDAIDGVAAAERRSTKGSK